ncbi:MAG: DUF2339 domain-containing protein [Sulfitobacter sp.]
MDGILVLLFLLALMIPVAVIYLLFSNGAVKKRVTELERELTVLRRDGAGPSENPDTSPSAVEPKAAAASGPWKAAQSSSQKSDETPVRPQKKRTPPPPPRPSPVADALARLGPWLRDNWFYAVSALSLALAGVFLVQYGMENGLLPPRARVLAGLGFGAVLIGVGEFIRRRFGDGVQSATAYLPSVFSGAGIVTLFAAILSGRLLYDLIGAETALIGMVVVAISALVLGWFHGPLLAAVGIIGAFSAPFLVGGSSDDPSWLFWYFALIAAFGLGVDTVRRWAWVSALTLVLAYLAGWLMILGDDGVIWAFIGYVTALAVMAIVIPARGLTPDHAGTLVSQVARRMRKFEGQDTSDWPIFPTLLSFGSLGATCASLGVVWAAGNAEFWMVAACLTGLAAAVMIWSVKAPALQDQSALPVLGFLGVVCGQGFGSYDVFDRFAAAYSTTSEADFPLQVTVLVGFGVLLSLLAAWRAARTTGFSMIWAATAALIAPATAILIEVTWTPAEVFGPYAWALHAAVIAGLMVFLAERFARRDGEDRLRFAMFTLSALSSIAFAFVIVLSSAALTVALAVTVVAAAALDRRFNLPPMGIFISVGVVTLGYRLVADPGLDWALDAAMAEMILAYGGTLTALVLGLWLLHGRERLVTQVMLDSAAWSTGGVLVSLLIWRAIDAQTGGGGIDSHWSMGLFATIWIGLAMAQVQRVATGKLVLFRQALAAVFAVVGLGALAQGVGVYNPIFGPVTGGQVFGPPVLNTLAVAYLMPAAVLVLGALRIKQMEPILRLGLFSLAGVLVALWATMAIRHFWQGTAGMDMAKGVSQPELYSYTIALLLTGAVVFYQSLARVSDMLRRAGLVVIGLAVAKVFLVDISGLGGLTRVFSLLVLGLSLAGLAGLNRWAVARQDMEKET